MLKKIFFKDLGFLAIAVFFFGCASTQNSASVAKLDKEVVVAAELNRSVVSRISFQPGQEGISPEAASELQKALAEARELGEVRTVEVAAWSDLEYPVRGKALSRKQTNLANKRAKNVEKLIERVEPSSKVKLFNMAKQPNAFQKWVDTRDAHVKQKLMSAGITTSTQSAIASDRASSALVFIEVERSEEIKK